MPVEYKKEGKIAIFTINQPEALNALSPDALADWADALVDFRDNPDLWVGIVTGAGEKAFCTGLDLKGFEPGTSLDPIRNGVPKPTLIRGLEIWKPLIAAVNGYAFGGGFEVALACDIRIASENARFGLTEVTLGLIPSWGGTQRLPRLLPLGKATELILMGKRIDAQEALNLGIVSKVVPQKELISTAKEWAEQICGLAPLAVRAAKEAIIKGRDMKLAEGLKLEAELGGKTIRSDDFAEGRKAFLEKRKPDYKAK
jgi:E-phenylitaconyl-CoA hydratase